MRAIYENRNKNRDNSVCISTANNLDFYAHWHPDIELLYVLEGIVTVGINSEERILKANEMSICSRNDIHYYNSIDMNSKSILIIFPEDIIKSEIKWSKYAAPVSEFLDLNSLGDKGKKISEIIMNIYNEDKHHGFMFKEFINLNLCNLFLELYRAFPEYYKSSINSANVSGIDKSPMQNALQYLESNYSEDISLDSMAKRIGLSEYYFSRLFKETTGMNFGVYLAYLRVQNARRDIEFTDNSIINIAYDCGFRSIRTFNRNFIRFCDMTPSEYREMNNSQGI